MNVQKENAFSNLSLQVPSCVAPPQYFCSFPSLPLSAHSISHLMGPLGRHNAKENDEYMANMLNTIEFQEFMDNMNDASEHALF